MTTVTLPSGIMWFDNTEISIEEKILAAVSAYHRKNKRRPINVWVNNKIVSDAFEIEGIKVVPLENILPHHFLAGPLG